MKSRHFRRPWLLAASSVLALLLLAEGIFRLFPDTLPATVRRTIRGDSRLGTVSHAYIGHLNRATARSDPYGFPNDWPWPNSPELVALGDSVTLGSGVDRAAAWPAIVGGALSGKGVVNLALPASGPLQHLRVYETFGLKLRARLVVVGFFASNDFWDSAMFHGWLESGARGNYLAWRDFGRPSSATLSLRQPAGALARSVLWRGELIAKSTYVGNWLLHPARPLVARPPSEVYDAPDGTRLELHPENFFRLTRGARPGTQVFTRVLAAVQRIHSLAHENGAKALVLFIPSKEEVYLPLLRESSPDSAAPLRGALAALGIPRLDLLDEFRRHAANGEVLFFATDSPLPNARGHQLIAELLVSHLRQHAEQYGL